jgi:hypothetical protein
MTLLASAVLLLIAVLARDALAQARPQVPSSALPGRERERFIDQPYPPVPRIQLQDGRPAPVITTPDRKRPAKRKRSRGRGSTAR